MSVGSKSPSLRMIWRVCDCFGIAARPAWTLRQVNMGMTQGIFVECSRRERWTCCRQTRHVAAASRAFFRQLRSATAHHIPLSAHTAPTVHIHLGCAATPLRHLEYFHDHVRIENMFFDGVRSPVNGNLSPDLSRPGMGIELKARGRRAFCRLRRSDVRESYSACCA